MGYYGWRPYVPVAEKRRQAERKLAKLKKQRQSVTPVTIEGRTIAKSFWGQSWCSNLERYSDYENRLARGRTYFAPVWWSTCKSRRARSRPWSPGLRSIKSRSRSTGSGGALERDLSGLCRNHRLVG